MQADTEPAEGGSVSAIWSSHMESEIVSNVGSKRRIDTLYTPFTRKSVDPTQRWLRQFTWFWNHCLA